MKTAYLKSYRKLNWGCLVIIAIMGVSFLALVLGLFYVLGVCIDFLSKII